MVAIGCDHGGYELKKEIIAHLTKKGVEFKDFGTYDGNSVDYPDIAKLVCKSILDGECENGILVCGTGIGISIAANKVNGIRAAVCSEPFSAKLSKIHNNSNILCFGARVVGTELAKMIVDEWVNAEFEGGRHQVRLDTITEIEQRN